MSYACTPMLSPAAVQVSFAFVEPDTDAVRLPGAPGRAMSAPKLYVCWSKVRPRESVGVTVTVLPATVTFRKWYSWEPLVGLVAAPHALPVCLLSDQPMA